MLHIVLNQDKGQHIGMLSTVILMHPKYSAGTVMQYLILSRSIKCFPVKKAFSAKSQLIYSFSAHITYPRLPVERIAVEIITSSYMSAHETGKAAC